MKVIWERASLLHCDLYENGETWRVADTDGHMTFSWGAKEVRLTHPRLTGAHQIDNAGTALAALAAIDESILDTPDDLNRGLGNAVWPARLHRLPAASLGNFPDGWEIWLDGGHNEGAAAALSQQVARWRAYDDKPLHLIMGMMKTKDPLAFARYLAPYTDSITAIPITGEPLKWEPYEVAAFLAGERISCQVAASLEEALRHLQAANREPGRILIAGSLYLAGRILAGLGQ